MREKKILEAEHISVSFRMYDRGLSQYDLHIISDLSVEVHEGEIMVIVGASGSGKSVTALSILGLLARQGKVTGGQILFQGKNLLAMTEQEMDRIRGPEIAMIFQDIMYSLNPVLTIGSQMTEGMRRHLGYTKEQAWAESVRLLRRTRKA